MHQGKMTKNNDTLKGSSLIPVGSTIAVQCENSGLWTHGTLISHGDMVYINRSRKEQLTKTKQLIVRNTKHRKTTITMCQ